MSIQLLIEYGFKIMKFERRINPDDSPAYDTRLSFRDQVMTADHAPTIEAAIVTALVHGLNRMMDHFAQSERDLEEAKGRADRACAQLWNNGEIARQTENGKRMVALELFVDQCRAKYLAQPVGNKRDGRLEAIQEVIDWLSKPNSDLTET